VTVAELEAALAERTSPRLDGGAFEIGEWVTV
jgi:hypothetical protein